jgi:hypothetical protein
VWKTSLLSEIRTHKIAAIILVTIAISSSILFAYAFTGFLRPPGPTSCPFNGISFTDATTPPQSVFQLVPPAKASICLTVQTYGQLPLNRLSLTPELGLYTTSQSTSTYSACSNSWTNCGGVTVSAAPAYAFFPSRPLHIVVTVNAPGSTRGVYWLWFWACQGGTMLWLRIGGPNQTLQNTRPALACLRTTFQVSLTFNSYTGMTPVYQNGTIPFL